MSLLIALCRAQSRPRMSRIRIRKTMNASCSLTCDRPATCTPPVGKNLRYLMLTTRAWLQKFYEKLTRLEGNGLGGAISGGGEKPRHAVTH